MDSVLELFVESGSGVSERAAPPSPTEVPLPVRAAETFKRTIIVALAPVASAPSSQGVRPPATNPHVPCDV